MKKYRIISTQKQTALVLNTLTNERQACFFARKEKPICGDFVDIQINKNEYLIKKILSRTNVFARANHKGLRQNIAANVDNEIIVVAVQPEPTRDLINRYLIAAHVCGMRPIIVFNKNDMDENFFNDTIQLYQNLGYRTLSTNAITQTNFDELLQIMSDKTSIFVGMSGVGKSSISELILGQKLKTGEISKKTGKGSHVTSVTHLYKIPAVEGYLIDSPGVWEYGLWKMSEHEIASGFPEIQNKLGHCKFSNCTHTHEPFCGIKLAVENNEINPLRYNSYLRIIDSMKYWD